MMLQILLNNLFSNIPGAPDSITDCPEVLAPVSLLQMWILLLQHPRCPPFQSLQQITDRLRRRILDVHMHMVFADDSLQDDDVFAVANLDDQFSATPLNVAFENMVTVLRYPHDMRRQSGCCMSVLPYWIWHALKLHSYSLKLKVLRWKRIVLTNGWDNKVVTIGRGQPSPYHLNINMHIML